MTLLVDIVLGQKNIAARKNKTFQKSCSDTEPLNISNKFCVEGILHIHKQFVEPGVDFPKS